MSAFPILSLLIFLPLLGASLILLTANDQTANRARTIAIATTVLSVLLSIPLYLGFDNTSYLLQYQEDYAWVPTLGITYSLGIDGIALAMILLTNFTGLIVILAGADIIKTRVAQYLATFLLMQAMLVGVFAARDAILFYVFWEGMLIPMYLNIGIWGSEARLAAAMKFFLYTFLGSIIMLVALLYLAQQAGSWQISSFYNLNLSLRQQQWLFGALLLAFAVKVPMWPLHTWLPDVHTAAPAGGSVVLAALMLKLGIYGLLRFNLPITPLACQEYSGLMLGLSLIAIIYIGLIALVQQDMKQLIAYSSIAHMGMATLGCFLPYDLVSHGHNVAIASLSLSGAVVQMVAHAFGSGALFLGIGWLTARHVNKSRLIQDYSGLATSMPIFAAFFMLFALSNLGLPGTAGFVGEFLVIVSAMKAHFWVAGLAATTIILAALYTLRLCQCLLFGPVANNSMAITSDLNRVELFNYTLLAIAVLALGLYPDIILNMVKASLDHLLVQSMPYGLIL